MTNTHNTTLDRDMDCNDVAALLSGLVDDEVDPQTRHEAERHIAGCRSCAQRLDEAERMSDELAKSVEIVETLPDGFADTVLLSTTRRTLQLRQPRWITWSGWLAAAAVLAISSTLLVLEYGPDSTRGADNIATNSGDGRDFNEIVMTSYPIGSEMRSAIADDGYVTRRSNSANTAGGAGSAVRAERGTREDLAPVELSEDDQDTIYAASVVLQMLEQFDVSDPRVAERMRDVVEYDELIPRLATSRQHVAAHNRAAVMAAESLLYRVSEGPIDTHAMHDMREVVEQLELTDRLNGIVGHMNVDHSM